jgi:hypothetical protein
LKRSGGDEPIWFVILTCMEAMLRLSLNSYLYLKPAKTLCLSYYLLCFLFDKIREQEGRTGSAPKQGREGKLCIHMLVNVKIRIFYFIFLIKIRNNIGKIILQMLGPAKQNSDHCFVTKES